MNKIISILHFLLSCPDDCHKKSSIKTPLAFSLFILLETPGLLKNPHFNSKKKYILHLPIKYVIIFLLNAHPIL